MWSHFWPQLTKTGHPKLSDPMWRVWSNDQMLFKRFWLHMAMIDKNHTLCVDYFHPKASLMTWVEHFIRHWKLALTRGRTSDLLFAGAQAHYTQSSGGKWKKPSPFYFVGENREEHCVMQHRAILPWCPKTSQCRWATDLMLCFSLSGWLVLTLTSPALQEVRLLEQAGEVSDGPACPCEWAQSSKSNLIARALVWLLVFLLFLNRFSIILQSDNLRWVKRE